MADARASHDLTATFTGEADDIIAVGIGITRGIAARYEGTMVGGTFGMHAAEGATLTVQDGEPFTVTWRWETRSPDSPGGRGAEGAWA